MTSEYKTWAVIKARCTNPRNTAYAHYGARGIKVCRRWLESYDAFLSDMGRRPSPAHSIERKDNSRGYTPGNCVWATKLEQMNNKSTSHVLEFNGVQDTIAGWSRSLGVKPRTLHMRLMRGWTVEQTLTEPVQPWRR